MPGKARSTRVSAARKRESRRENYNGHEIVYPEERKRRFFIDGRPVVYGVAGDTYYLNVYAYEPGDTLEEVIKNYLNYKDKVFAPNN